MVYNPSIPQATDRPSDSQLDLLNNFGQLNTQFSVNHVALTAGGQNGYHTKIYFPNGVADPNLGKPIGALYTKVDGNGNAQLYFQNDVASGDIVQLTGIAPTNSGSNYFIQTPFGLKFAWGTYVASGTTATVTFASNFVNPIACLATQNGPDGGSRASTYQNLTVSGVTIHTSNTGSGGSYWVVGT